MPPYEKPSVDDVLRKYGSKIEGQVHTEEARKEDYSVEYTRFKQEMAPDLSKYEKWCRSLGSVVKLNVAEKDREKIQKFLSIAHLDLEPWQPLSLSMMSFLSVFLLGLLISFGLAFMKGGITAFPFLFFFIVIFVSLFLFYFVNGYPQRLANKWRLKASAQMVPAILYIVVYMRHTPNLEKAIAFASQHLKYPLSLDFKKVFYDVEVGKFSTIKESLDNYLETWRDFSIEFIEAFHLIEGSLFEPNNDRRIVSLEKSLQVVLDGVYDKMLNFTHTVRSPLTNVYMLAVVLPVLGIALLPLASAMIGDYLQWIHVFLLYNLLIPFITLVLVDKIMFLRPGGYGESDLLERNPFYFQYKSRGPYFTAFIICLPFFIIGFLPLLFQYTPLPDMLNLSKDFTFADIGLGKLGTGSVFGFTDTGKGPFGIGALVLGMFLPLGMALFFSMAYKDKTKELIKERENTQQLEKEFNNSLFQLGNRLGNGTPPELVFGKVAESSQGLKTQDFFRRVNYNIKQMGMGVEKAIFDINRGAIAYFPSDLIATSMRVLIESSKKGLTIAAVSLMSISQYVKNIQKITDRLKDMLAEVISDMKSNMTFLAPLLSGIVVGLAAMITAILEKLESAKVSGGNADLGAFGDFTRIFEFTKMIPPYYLQIIIGVYLIQVIFILTSTLVTVNSGEDKLEKTNKTGKNLFTGILLYFIVALIATIALFALFSLVLGDLGG